MRSFAHYQNNLRLSYQPSQRNIRHIKRVKGTNVFVAHCVWRLTRLQGMLGKAQQDIDTPSSVAMRVFSSSPFLHSHNETIDANTLSQTQGEQIILSENSVSSCLSLSHSLSLSLSLKKALL